MAKGGKIVLLWVGIAAGILAAWSRHAAWGPRIALPVLVVSLWPLARAWRRAGGLTLRPAIAWGVLAVGLGILAQVQGAGESLASGRPMAGHWAYLSSLATLAGLISVLGARTPGGGAWAILMGLLVLIFLLPWLEGSGLARGAGGMDRLRLDPPWSIFFALLALAGVTNYLPTRFGLPAAFVGASLVVELAGLVMTGWEPPRRALIWSASPLLLGFGLILALNPAAPSSRPAEPLARLWLWFRDHWGVVWALRVRERFNRAAEAAGWPMRLGWQGPISPDGGEAVAIPEAAVRTLATLLRRFADASRIDRASSGDPPALARPRGMTHDRGGPPDGRDRFRTSPKGGPLERNSAAATATVILAVLGSIAALYFLKVILVPVVLALLVACILSPITRLLRRLLPLGATGAAVVLFLLLTMLGLYLSALAAESLMKATTTLPADADNLSRMLSDRVKDLSSDMPYLRGVLPEAGTIDLLGDRNRAFLIATLSDRLGDLSSVVVQGLIVMVLALFFLIESEMLAAKLVRFFAPAPGDAHAAERAIQDLVHQIRAYLIARTLINIGLGMAFALALWILGVHYYLAQGAMVALTNFVPYVGQVLGGAVPVLATLLQGKQFGDALIVAAVYLGLLGAEGYIVTPYVLGRSLDLNGTTVLIACLFWGFLWGLVGLVLAMPFAVCMKLVFQQVPSLHRWADLMSQTWVPPVPVAAMANGRDADEPSTSPAPLAKAVHDEGRFAS